MRRIRVVIILMVFAVVGVLTTLAVSSASSSDAAAGPHGGHGAHAAHSGHSVQRLAAAQPSCRQFWQHSDHTTRVRWYHCHATSDPYVKRVHICGVSGTLHGVSVAQFPDGVWLRANHRHDVGGEGC